MKKSEELAKLYRQTRKALGLNGEPQQDQLRKLRDLFGLSNEELAAALEIPLTTLLCYLAPESAAKHRTMPAADRLVLARILEARTRRKGKA